MAKPSIHNPANFDPADYRVVGYFDNQPPEMYWGETASSYADRCEGWRIEGRILFGMDFRSKVHCCVHCGNRSVRYVAAVRHEPTGDVVCFGGVCATNRLPLAGRDQFRLNYIRSNAENQRRHAERMAKVGKYLEANPEFKVVYDRREHEIHQRNGFLQNVCHKLLQYGDLSDKQRDAVIQAAKRDRDYAERKAQEAAQEAANPRGEAPVGRVTVTGHVLAVKWVENIYGGSEKMMLEIDDTRAKVWASTPSIYDDDGTLVKLDRGDHVSVRLSLTRSDDDPTMAWGKRPSNGKLLAKATTCEKS